MQTYPLTAAQTNILTMAQYYSGTALCNIGGTTEFAIDGLNFEIIEQTLNGLINAMDGFRIRITKKDDQYRQYFCDHTYEKIPFIDVRYKASVDIDLIVKKCMEEPMVLFDSPLYRFTILQKE